MPSLPIETLRQLATPLDGRAIADLAASVAHRRIVQIGEASHGTSEFYTVRAEITKRLVEKHGFSFVAVEGDWPACMEVHRFVTGTHKEAPGTDEGELRSALEAFDRWPAWMWANWEVAEFATWLRERNRDRSDEAAVGFFGLDVYSLNESLDAVLSYLAQHRPDSVDAARRAFICFEPYRRDQGGVPSVPLVPTDCEDEVIEILTALRAQRAEARDGAALFDAEQNAYVTLNAERYYRASMRGGGTSWNVRDRHMQDTLERVLDEHGPAAKAVIWAHNTHVGDARYTDMARAGMVNLGQLSREAFGRNQVALVGFGTYAGTVLAGASWGAPQEVMDVPPATESSWEHAFHQAGLDRAIVRSADLRDEPAFSSARGHRAIGVVYRPERERFGNYVATVLPDRYDAFVFLDETHALHPVGGPGSADRPPATFPWGV